MDASHQASDHQASDHQASDHHASDLRTFIQPRAVSAELIPTILTLRELFGAKLPADITYEPATVAEPALRGMAFHTSYDEGYCGHFSIPDESGAAADFAQVMAQPDPLGFIKRHLWFGTGADAEAQQIQDHGEWVIFGPGLNTLHQLKPGFEQETTTVQRLQEQYVPLLKIPMGQIHLGTDLDQGAAEIPVSAPVRQFLEANRGALEEAGLFPQLRENTVSFYPRQRDRLEAVLSQQGFVRPLFQRHAVQLLQLNETAQRSMVWMVYSRATAEFSGALRQYIADDVARQLKLDPERSEMSAREAVEQLLRRFVTVISIGNTDRNWPDGPAYVHYSALSDRPEGGTDPLTQSVGVHAGAPEGAGRDAVFLHVDGLFSGFDAHNFGAAGAANLRLIMDLNQCSTYHQLWEKGQTGPLQRPTLAQTAASVVQADGARWLWEPDTAWTGVHLPSAAEAAQILADLPERLEFATKRYVNHDLAAANGVR